MNRRQKQQLDPFTHKIKHLECRKQRTHTNPNHFAGKRSLREEREERGPWRDLHAREVSRFAGASAIPRVAMARRLGHRGERRRNGERNETAPKTTPGRGLYPPETGSPDALNVAPDASGDHRTHAQRGFQNCGPPDAGLSVRCPRARLVSTGRSSPDDAGTLFLRSVSAIRQTHRTGRTETASGAASGAPLSPFST